MSRRMWWGVAVVVVGLLLLAANFGYIAPFSVWGLWPILLILPSAKFAAGGMTIVVRSDRGRVRAQAATGVGYRLVALWVALGAGAQLLRNINLIPWDWGDVAYGTLPLLLVGIGLALMLRPRDGLWHWSQKERMGRAASGTSVIVGDLRFGARPWVFKSPMSVSLWAGDVGVDLTTAQFTPGDNFLALHGWAGDLDVRVPDGIEVVVEAHCGAGQLRVFGERRDGLGCDLKATRAATDGADPIRLFIGADLTFGEITVR